MPPTWVRPTPQAGLLALRYATLAPKSAASRAVEHALPCPVAGRVAVDVGRRPGRGQSAKLLGTHGHNLRAVEAADQIVATALASVIAHVQTQQTRAHEHGRRRRVIDGLRLHAEIIQQRCDYGKLARGELRVAGCRMRVGELAAPITG